MRRLLKAATLLALLAATAFAAGERTHRMHESHTLGHKTTVKKRFELPVRAPGRRVSLRVRAVVREGEAKVLVRDAAGRVRQQAHLRPSGAKSTTYDVDTEEERAAGGEWTVELEFKDATGSYEFTWTTELAPGARN